MKAWKYNDKNIKAVWSWVLTNTDTYIVQPQCQNAIFSSEAITYYIITTYTVCTIKQHMFYIFLCVYNF